MGEKMFRKRSKTRIQTIVGGEFIEGRSYIISGRLSNEGVDESTLHLVFRRPGAEDSTIDIKTDKEGNFCSEVFAQSPGNFVISVEYNGVAKKRWTETDISLTVAIIEVPELPEYLKMKHV